MVPFLFGLQVEKVFRLSTPGYLFFLSPVLEGSLSPLGTYMARPYKRLEGNVSARSKRLHNEYSLFYIYEKISASKIAPVNRPSGSRVVREAVLAQEFRIFRVVVRILAHSVI